MRVQGVFHKRWNAHIKQLAYDLCKAVPISDEDTLMHIIPGIKVSLDAWYNCEAPSLLCMLCMHCSLCNTRHCVHSSIHLLHGFLKPFSSSEKLMGVS